jgi:hypothetical protein
VLTSPLPQVDYFGKFFTRMAKDDRKPIFTTEAHLPAGRQGGHRGIPQRTRSSVFFPIPRGTGLGKKGPTLLSF